MIWRKGLQAMSAYINKKRLRISASGLAILGVFYTTLWPLLDNPYTQFARERRECDRQVETLLRGTDLLEVVRAASITAQLECSIGRHLPEMEQRK